ncbi:MAG: LLM class F420-dependent oxidoreductase [Anaerolineae bacterium]|nr:LLM class F420-dependent oxidoreductase [Anaerolineae bacterium]
MKFGVVFPQTEIGPDPVAVRDYAQAAEGLGYRYLLAYEHVIGANPDRPGGWRGPYTHRSLFHEPFVLFGYLAGLTQKLELVTGVVILPQRQTVLVAKQAAAVDVLSGGRLRLGVGTGWNQVEYEALGENFHNRGRREEEQIKVLRALWQNELVTFKGKWHQIPDAGLNPLPVQRPIPIWLGGMAEVVLKRAARLADGWFPQFQPGPQAEEVVSRLRQYLREAGRDQATFGIDGRIPLGTDGPPEWVARARAWQALGATHLAVNTMGIGLKSPAAHIEAIRRFKEAIEDSGADFG